MLRLVLALLVAIGGLPLCLDALLRTIDARRRVPEDPLWLAIGLMAGMALIFTRRPNWFAHTMLHEACHLLACRALGVRVHRFMASDGSGGEVQHAATGPLRTALISLAPYTVPLVLGPLLIARALTPEGWPRAALTALCAVAFVTHLTGLVHNVRLNLRDSAGDLAKVGRPLALAIIASVLLLVTAWTISVLWDDTWRLSARGLPRVSPASSATGGYGPP